MIIYFNQQNKHLNFVDLGFNRQNVICVKLPNEVRNNLNAFRQEVSKINGVKYVSGSRQIPVAWENTGKAIPQGKNKEDAWALNTYAVSEYFTETLGIKILEGRSFAQGRNDSCGFLINQKMKTYLGLENPVGTELTVNGKKGEIIGVTSDYFFELIMMQKFEPGVFTLVKDAELMNLMLKIKTGAKIDLVQKELERLWKKTFPNSPFNSETLDKEFQNVYSNMADIDKVFLPVAIFEIIFSCLGLLALASFAVRKKVKEIGIRKVMGASVPRLNFMLIKEFLMLVIISNILSIPVAYFLGNMIVEAVFTEASFRLNMPIIPFLAASCISLTAALLAVIVQTTKAVRANPVESLHAE